MKERLVKWHVPRKVSQWKLQRVYENGFYSVVSVSDSINNLSDALPTLLLEVTHTKTVFWTTWFNGFICSSTMWVAQIIKRQMIGELARMWKEVVMASYLVLYRQWPRDAENLMKISVAKLQWFEPGTCRILVRIFTAWVNLVAHGMFHLALRMLRLLFHIPSQILRYISPHFAAIKSCFFRKMTVASFNLF
jgi:hypothetical protein